MLVLITVEIFHLTTVTGIRFLPVHVLGFVDTLTLQPTTTLIGLCLYTPALQPLCVGACSGLNKPCRFNVRHL